MKTVMEYDVFSEQSEMGPSGMVASKRGGEGEGGYYFSSLLSLGFCMRAYIKGGGSELKRRPRDRE